MALALLSIALIGAIFSTKKYKGLTRVFYTGIVWIFYFFILVFIFLVFGII